MVHRLSCSVICGILLDQGSNRCSWNTRQILNHRTTREAPFKEFYNSLLALKTVGPKWSCYPKSRESFLFFLIPNFLLTFISIKDKLTHRLGQWRGTFSIITWNCHVPPCESMENTRSCNGMTRPAASAPPPLVWLEVQILQPYTRPSHQNLQCWRPAICVLTTLPVVKVPTSDSDSHASLRTID